MRRLLLCLLLLAASGVTAAASAEPEFVIRIQGHRFEPAELHVPEGKKVRITLENLDDTPEEFDSHALNREKHVSGKGRATLYIGPLEPGRYLFEGESVDAPGGAALGVIVVP